MNTTVRNLDGLVFRSLKARAALEGKTIGELLNEAIRVYLLRPNPLGKTASLTDLEPEKFPAGNEHLSEEIDAIVYGTQK